MNEIKVGRRERRRKKVETKMEGNFSAGGEFQKTIENVEFSIKPHVTQSLEKLVRRDTYKVIHLKSGDVHTDGEQDFFQQKSGDGSGNESADSKNLTYSLEKDSEKSSQCTYNIDKPPDLEPIQPVPAPRKRKSIRLQPEKVSSDTDRDVTEIDLDDLLVKSQKSDLSSKLSPVSNKSDHTKNDVVVAPIPKPRKTIKHLQTSEPNSEKLKSSRESLNSETYDLEEKTVKANVKEEPSVEKDFSEHPKSNELPLLANLQSNVKSDDPAEKTKKQKKIVEGLLDRKHKKKKSKTFSRFIKLEKKKIPKISSLLKESKEEEIRENKPEVVEEKTDFQIDSPRYKKSAENGRIYVQGKNGFHVMEKDEVLKNEKQNLETDENGGIMGDSTVKTAVLFQKYWSRSMIYFHGVLAGFGFSHAATVTAMMLHFNYDPEEFIGVYSCLSLKIHYVFYTLTALCIVSCFDRIDIGHMNRKHWQIAWKIPSVWVVLIVYVTSFVLTFANQMTEAKFDAFPDGNKTEIWNMSTQGEIQLGLLQWYHSVWARDLLVLFAWLVIALTTFDDFLHCHINNMAKYAEVKEEDKRLRHKTDFL